MPQQVQKITKILTASFALGFVSAATAKTIATMLGDRGLIKQDNVANTREVIELFLELLALDVPLWFKSTIVSKLTKAFINTLSGNELLGKVAEKATKFGMINELSRLSVCRAAAYGLGGQLVEWVPSFYAPKKKPLQQENATAVHAFSPQ